MQSAFYIAGAVAVLATLLAITRSNLVHALLYLVVSFFGVAVVLYTLGAPFVAALEIIVYAGAIVVLVLFVIMMLNPGSPEVAHERSLLTTATWAGPALLAAVLLAETLLLLGAAGGEASAPAGGRVVEPRAVGRAMYGPYLLAVELTGILLLAALVAAYHVGRREELRRPEVEDRSFGREQSELAARHAELQGVRPLGGTGRAAGGPEPAPDTRGGTWERGGP